MTTGPAIETAGSPLPSSMLPTPVTGAPFFGVDAVRVMVSRSSVRLSTRLGTRSTIASVGVPAGTARTMLPSAWTVAALKV